MDEKKGKGKWRGTTGNEKIKTERKFEMEINMKKLERKRGKWTTKGKQEEGKIKTIENKEIENREEGKTIKIKSK